MRCRAARGLFSRRVDGRLAEPDRSALDAHLAGCDRCRAELARWEGAARALRGIGPTPLPAGIADRAFRAAIAAEPAPPLAAWFVGAARRAVLAGAVAAVAAWLGALAVGSAPAPAAAEDPMELAVQLQLFTPEAGDGP
ncbi:MAG TPA: zf-HC2 domain-containing protein [Anaeromyxobacteraceae bacterium]|nr:zf-HC2 domain-containing protein [Anaeromyxobacteraceae bacterium]